MSNSSASAHDRDREARPQPARASHAATPNAAADLRAQPASDPEAEIRELVDRFESAFADLGTSTGAEDVQRHPEAEADLFPDFSQDIFEEVVAAPSVAAESARVFAMPRRDSEAPKAGAKPAPAPATGPDHRDEVSLDEAFSILRASENRSAGAPAADTAAPAVAQPRPQPNSGERARVREPRAQLEAELEAEPDSGTAEWTTRSHKVRSIAIAATAAALVIGIAVGYLYGRTPAAQTPSTAIGTSQQGGTLLRLDPELHKR